MMRNVTHTLFKASQSGKLNDRLKSSPSCQLTARKRLKRIWHSFWGVMVWFLAPSNEPRVTECRDRQGNTCWRVYHPATGKTAVLYSEREVIAWIENCWPSNR